MLRDSEGPTLAARVGSADVDASGAPALSREETTHHNAPAAPAAHPSASSAFNLEASD